MRNTVLMGIVASCLSALTLSCGAGAHIDRNVGNDSRHVIRLMSYNVGVFGKYSEDSATEIAAMINDLGVTTCAVNELDSCNARNDIYQAKHLAECLGDGWDYSFGRAISFRGGSYGDGIVTRDRILDKYNIVLPQGDGAEQRVCVVIETERYVFAATHLDHVSGAAALDQARLITDTLMKSYGAGHKHVFLCGDMNARPDSEVMEFYLRHWKNLSGTEFTFPSRSPEECIDYILLLNNGAKVNVLDSRVCTSSACCDVADASDHLPVMAEIELLP